MLQPGVWPEVKGLTPLSDSIQWGQAKSQTPHLTPSNPELLVFEEGIAQSYSAVKHQMIRR